MLRFSIKFCLGFAVLVPVLMLSSVADDVTNDQGDAQQQQTEQYVPKSKAELKKMLTPMQFYVTQEEGTERAFTNEYWNNKQSGMYQCVVCGQKLFSSATKYRSGTGWPSFYKPVSKSSVGVKDDSSLFFTRIEVHCSRCKAHLGHVFDDGPKPTGKRYCMNSASLKFIPADKANADKAATAANDDQ